MRGIISCALIALVAICLGMPARAEYRQIETRSAQRILIFVHGLWGDPDSTFSAGRGSPSWFEIIKADATSLRGQPSVSSYSIGLLAFPAGRGDRLSASQVAGILTRNMRDAGLLEGNKEFYFVTHSLGGIVIKEMLLDSFANPLAKSLFTQTKGVFLISVPTSGSEAADFIANKLPVFAGGRIIADLRSVGDNTFLQSLQRRWDNMMRLPLAERPSVYCAYETQPTKGLLVVPQQYSERFCDEAPEAMNEDHITIVKPSSVKSQVHDWLRGSLADLHAKRAASQRPHNGEAQGVRPGAERRGSPAVQSQKASIPLPKNELNSATGPDYRDLVESIKITFVGFDESTFSPSTGVPLLVFSFTNLSPKSAKISGASGCDLVNWSYPRNGRRFQVDKAATVEQVGSRVVRVPAQSTIKISYSLDRLNALGSDVGEARHSVCKFYVGFGESPMLHQATAIVASPAR